ncbi:MAG: hypothetical protein WCD53_16095 [Microcoleus sp.]
MLKEEGRRKKEEAIKSMVSAIQNVLTAPEGYYIAASLFNEVRLGIGHRGLGIGDWA